MIYNKKCVILSAVTLKLLFDFDNQNILLLVFQLQFTAVESVQLKIELSKFKTFRRISNFVPFYNAKFLCE